MQVVVQRNAVETRAMLARVSRRVSRRGLLGAGLAVPVAVSLPGCRHTTSEIPVAGTTALDAALADEDRLIAAYDAAFAADPSASRTLGRLRQDHEAHRAALLAAGAQRGPSSTPSTRPPATRDARLTRLALAEAERSASRARTEACLRAPRTLAPLLGSVAASEAAHAVALHA
jgi:hypothetical protein